MLEFIKSNMYDISVVLVFIVGCVLLIKKGYEGKVEQMLFYLVCKAEEIYGSGTGDLKYSAVVTWIYDRLPTIVKILFSTRQIDKYIEAAVLQMKEYLAKNTQAQARVTNTISLSPGITVMSEEVLSNLAAVKSPYGGQKNENI